jgi:predicted Zn-dependent peptidase
LQEVTETQRRSLETRLLQNQFWLNTIASYDQNGWDISGALSIDEQIKRLTPARVAAAAKQYFDEKNVVQVTLAPVAAGGVGK